MVVVGAVVVLAVVVIAGNSGTAEEAGLLEDGPLLGSSFEQDESTSASSATATQTALQRHVDAIFTTLSPVPPFPCSQTLLRVLLVASVTKHHPLVVPVGKEPCFTKQVARRADSDDVQNRTL